MIFDTSGSLVSTVHRVPADHGRRDCPRSAKRGIAEKGVST